jgi:hypothetical protein
MNIYRFLIPAKSRLINPFLGIGLYGCIPVLRSRKIKIEG